MTRERITIGNGDHEKISKTDVETSVLRSPKAYLVLKRALDILISFAGIIVLAPAFLVISVAVMVGDGKGKPFFVQTRVGKNGLPFPMYKFRTMYPGAENEHDLLVSVKPEKDIASKIRNDPRVTKVGRWLRRTGLDELPQLLNVLKGEMSLVGPRPPLPAEVEMYDDYQKLRLLVKPGLTCLWQITPKRNDIPFDEWIQLDLGYICKRNLLLDLEIIVRTFGVVFPGEGI